MTKTRKARLKALVIARRKEREVAARVADRLTEETAERRWIGIDPALGVSVGKAMTFMEMRRAGSGFYRVLTP